jgi:folate-binding protein YgfZ
MEADTEKAYRDIRSGRAGFYEQKRGLIAVWGKEAVQFLDGMITNDMKRLEDGAQMLAAFPNAQGRLLALVRVELRGDIFLLETEATTRDKLFQSLHRFTLAGDFFVEDRSDKYTYFEIFGPRKDVNNPNVGDQWPDTVVFEDPQGASYFVPAELADKFRSFLTDENDCVRISADLYQTLRIEAGIPKYGIDMDETTVVPELGLDGLISYTKGCYIGQEIIARIHFRGHVAKQLTGLLSEPVEVATGFLPGVELTSQDGKPAGKITSVTHSPSLDKTVALAFVRYDNLAQGTELLVDGKIAVVTPLPFVN